MSTDTTQRLFAKTMLANMGNTSPTDEQITRCLALVDVPSGWKPEDER